MHFKLLGLLVVAALPLSSCGGESSGLTSRRDGLNNADWVVTVVTFAAGDFVFPLDCLGETAQFVGNVTFQDHLVPGPRGTHDNWHIAYDPEQFTSLTTGQTWVFEPGFTNSGDWVIDESGQLIAGNNHEFINLRNTTTGQQIRWRLQVHYAVNALGEYTRQLVSFGCTLR